MAAPNAAPRLGRPTGRHASEWAGIRWRYPGDTDQRDKDQRDKDQRVEQRPVSDTVVRMTIADEKYVLLTTFRRDGTPVPSPVWNVDLGDNTIGFWTSSGSGKAKRIAHTDRVTVQACDARGTVKPGSSSIEGTARLVIGPDLDEIRAKVVAKYGFMTKVTKLLGTLGGIVKRNRIPYGDRGVVITLPG